MRIIFKLMVVGGVFLFSSCISVEPVIAGGKKAVARAAITRVINSKSPRQATLAANRKAGAIAETKAAENIRANGHTILGSQVSVQTRQGRRVIDHLIKIPSGKIIAAIEVKSGRAFRTRAQLAKDKAMASEGGTIVGRNAPAPLRNTRIKLHTAIRRH